MINYRLRQLAHHGKTNATAGAAIAAVHHWRDDAHHLALLYHNYGLALTRSMIFWSSSTTRILAFAIATFSHAVCRVVILFLMCLLYDGHVQVQRRCKDRLVLTLLCTDTCRERGIASLSGL